MRYLKRSAIIFSLLLFLFGGAMVGTANAQRRRAIIVYRPFFHHWGGYDPYWYDPYYREARDRYYLESRARGDRNELEKHRQKYLADGVLTDKERRELADDEKDYNNSIRNLNRFNRRY